MSLMTEHEFGGKEDCGSITTMELIEYLFNEGFRRINSMHNLWKCSKENESDREEGIHEAFELDKQGWKIEQTNKWAFDVD